MVTELLLMEGREGPAVCCLPGCTSLTAGWGAPRVGGRLPAVRSHQPPPLAATTTSSHYQPPPAPALLHTGLSWAPRSSHSLTELINTETWRDLERPGETWRKRGEREERDRSASRGLCGAVWPLWPPLITPALASPPRSLPHNLLQGIN